MDNETLFYVCGIALAVSAVVISFVGLKAKKFPGKAFPLVLLWFALLAVGATTYSVLHAEDEEHHKEAELEHAGEEFEAEGDQASVEESGGTLEIAADPTELAYDKEEMSVAPGQVTIKFTNPATIKHNVAVDDEGGNLVLASDIIGKGKTSISGKLPAGNYTFFCAVPGHREAGMEGFLNVE